MIYLDSSALVKLVLQEEESNALLAFVEPIRPRTTSVVATVGVFRAVRRAFDDPSAQRRTEQILSTIDLVALSPEVRRIAVSLGPMSLRSHDAIHLASALTVAEDLETFICYDARLTAAASSAGLAVAAPG